MSETVRYKGKLKPIELKDNQTLKSFAFDMIKEHFGEERAIRLGEDCLEELGYELDYVVVNNTLYKVEKEILDTEYDFFEGNKNSDGTIDFHVMYYNGGMCFNEAMEEVLNNI